MASEDPKRKAATEAKAGGSTLVIHNLTPHDVSIYAPDADAFSKPIATFKSEGVWRAAEARPQKENEALTIALGFPVKNSPIYSKIEIPAAGNTGGLLKDPKAALIVSSIVAEFLKANPVGVRAIILSPNSGPDSVVRSDKGDILGVKGLWAFL